MLNAGTDYRPLSANQHGKGLVLTPVAVFTGMEMGKVSLGWKPTKKATGMH
jgi:hypothetical protein